MGGVAIRLLKGSGTLLLAVLSACGGRTSTLEPDVYGNQPTNESTSTGGSSGSGTKGGSAASSGATATGGTTSSTGGTMSTGATTSTGASTSTGGATPTAGAPGMGASAGTGAFTGTAGSPAGGASSGGSAGAASGGVTSVDPFVQCTNYCNILTQGPCPAGISSDECAVSCATELSAQAPECQAIGTSFLSCLATVYKNSNGCSQAEALSRAKCSTFAEAYEACTKPGRDPVPPVPPLAPGCAGTGTGSAGNGTCSLEMKCSSGAYYTVYCYESSQYTSSCSCDARLPDGSAVGAGFDLNEGVALACQDALASCGYPPQGAK